MKLEQIDKIVYRKRLNIVIASSIALLMVLSVAFGAILIELLGNAIPVVNPETGESSSNFRFNFAGVILAFLTSASILQQLKNKPFFYEIYYVWRLKQIQNVIYRRLAKIKSSTEKKRDPVDRDAFVILNYYYTSLKQVYLLDDNTLTLSNLSKDINNLDTLMLGLNIEVNTEDFERKMLINYR